MKRARHSRLYLCCCYYVTEYCAFRLELNCHIFQSKKYTILKTRKVIQLADQDLKNRSERTSQKVIFCLSTRCEILCLEESPHSEQSLFQLWFTAPSPLKHLCC